MVGPLRLDHELKYIMEQFIKHVEGQFNGQGTTSTYCGLPQRLKCILFFPFRGLAIWVNHNHS